MSDKVQTITRREIARTFQTDYKHTVAPDDMMCVEICCHEGDKLIDRMAMPPAEARAIARAMLACADEIEAAQ